MKIQTKPNNVKRITTIIANTSQLYKDGKIPYTVGSVRKSNRNIIERHKIDTPRTQIHDRSISWLDTGTKKFLNITSF
jgi:hypothetical protein